MKQISVIVVICVGLIFCLGCSSSIVPDRGVWIGEGVVISSIPAKEIQQATISGVVVSTDSKEGKITIDADSGSQFLDSNRIITINGSYPEGKKPRISVNISKESSLNWADISPGRKIRIVARDDKKRSLVIIKINIE